MLRRVSAAAALVIAGALVYVLLVRAGDSATPFPEPPAAERQPSAVREHLRERYDAARQTPRSAAAVGAYCMALHADMFYEAADSCYSVPIELAPGEWQWLYYRALLRSDLGDAGELAAQLRAVVDRAPAFSPAWLRLGDAEFKAGRYEAAERAWIRVTELPEPDRSTPAPVPDVTEVPAAAYASLGLARIRLLRGDAAGARQILERMVAAGPPFSSAYRVLGDVLADAGDEREAALAVARARRLPPYAPYADPMVSRLAAESRNSTLLIRLASEANLAVNGPWAEYLSRRAVEFDPDNPEVVIKLGRVLRTLGKTEEALTYFRRYEQMVPGDVPVLAHIGSALSELGRFGEAEPYLRRAAASLDDALSHYNLGLLLAITGRLDEAVAEYQVALERDPNDVNARGNLAAVLVRQGRLDRAARELTRVIELDPENAVAHTNLGLVYAEAGDLPRARRALREALRLDPTLGPAAEALQALGGN